MADSNELRVSLTGLEETLKALKQYDPEARKELFNAVASATRLIRDDARRAVPSLPIPTGWRNQSGMPNGDGSWQNRTLTRGGKGWPPFEANNVKRLIKSYMGARRARKGSILTTRGIVVNASGEGVIYEFAKTSHRSTKYPWVNSVPFINHLGSMKGGRVIWAAGERRKDEVRKQILDALAVANAKLQSRFDSVKEGDR
jgi:hypothetical protein